MCLLQKEARQSRMRVLVLCKIYISSWMVLKNGGKRKVMAHMINVVSFSSPQPEWHNTDREKVESTFAVSTAE
jgi:hypothetical protein